MSSTPAQTSYQAFLRQAERQATPYTRRIALQLAGLAFIVAGGFALVQLWPWMQHAGSLLQQGWQAALAALSSFATQAVQTGAAVVRFTASATASAFVAGAGWTGLASASAACLVAVAWHRARTYVMQSAIELLLKGEAALNAQEGMAMLQDFARTQRRMYMAWATIGLLAVVSALIGTAQGQGLSPLVAGWAALLVASVVVTFVHNNLSVDRVAAYALYRSCPLPKDQFKAQLRDRGANLVTEKMSLLYRMGLMEDSHLAQRRIMRAARAFAA